jgi:hypothetical protein
VADAARQRQHDCAPTIPETLGMWVLYRHPPDHPDAYVARKFFVGHGLTLFSDEVMIEKSLDALRTKIPRGLMRMPRRDDDDPHVVESWL